MEKMRWTTRELLNGMGWPGAAQRRNGGRELKLLPSQNFVAIGETKNGAVKTEHMELAGSNIPLPQKKDPARTIF